jgi:predicted PurR-regulated permease PerM
LTSRYSIAAWIVAAALLVAVLHLHLLPALLAGLLVYELVHMIAPRIPFRGDGRMAAVGLLATVIAGLVTLAIFGLVAFLHGDAGNLPRLLQKMAEIVETSHDKLPPWLAGMVPYDATDLQGSVTRGLQYHAQELRTVGGEVGLGFVHALIGMVIGAMVSLHEAASHGNGGPLSRELSERARRLGEAFRRVVFAQVRISALNTIFTAIYLLVVLHLFDVHLPLGKTLILVTFIVGLLPVLGNLVSNTMIVVVSLSVSAEVALASLAYLVVIHKLEYFLNARIVGGRIHAAAWELLLAMIVMEAAFGISGLVAAPIYYAYLKDELSGRGLV